MDGRIRQGDMVCSDCVGREAKAMEPPAKRYAFLSDVARSSFGCAPSKSAISSIAVLVLTIIFLFGCSLPQIIVSDKDTPKGVYHRVKSGETLFRIAKSYNVSVQELAEVNDITKPDQLSADKVLFIPDATDVIDIPPAATAKKTNVPTKSVEGGNTSAPLPGDSGSMGGLRENAVKKRIVEEDLTDRPSSGKADRAVMTADKAPKKAPQAVAKTVSVKPDRGEKSSSLQKNNGEAATKNPAPAAKNGPREIAKVSPPPKDEPHEEVHFDRGRFIWPLKGKITSRFGIQPDGMKFNGIRINAREGSTVVAANEGTVIYSAPLKYYGDTVIIKHDDQYITVYTYLKDRSVKADDHVRKGQKIALVGGPSEGHDDPSLYFEIRHKNKARNPEFFLP
jgi:lipoprotein NlpD